MSKTIEKKGLPNEFTAGEVGDIYVDTDTGYKFKCVEKSEIKYGKQTDYIHTWLPIKENYKQMVDDASTALSEKLQTEVDKNNLVDEIGKIDVGAIAQGIVKGKGVTLRDVVDTASSISDYRYVNNISINTIDYVNATSIGASAMASCLSLKNVNMPSVTSIGAGAMASCMSLKNVNMPSVTSVGNNAMGNCISLKSINMPSAESLRDYAMQNCVLITSVNMPYVTSVGIGAMGNCISLKNVNMPSVTSVGNNAMGNCISLKSIRLGANRVATLSNTGVFRNTPIAKGTGYIYVPDELVEDYKTATNWSVYADQIRPMSEYVEEVNE